LELAGRVQRGLIPAVAPDIQGLDIAGRSDACEEVGGDYYDFLYGPDFSPDSLKIIVGDISGHGVDAALLMTSARAFIRSRAAQALPSSEMVSTMNRDLTLDMEDTGHFMTLFMVEIQPEQGTLHWVRAGHEPALLYKPDVDAFEELLGQGLPLGIDRRFAYQENELGVIQPGMIIALSTDGIWESINARGESFGKKRFRQIIRTYAKQPAYQIVNRVFEELNAFTEGLPSHDDITLVIIKKDEVDMASE
jgi:sigma-B regulation protein RsbU (phosphoserine phosphatase)